MRTASSSISRRPRSRAVDSHRPVVHVADPLAAEGLALLRDRCDVRVTTGLGEAELSAVLGDVDALVVRSETKVTAAVLAAAPRLQVVGRAGVGVDNIDVPAATARGVYVVNAPLGNVTAAAEHALTLALALMRKVVAADESIRRGEWTRSKFIGNELRGKTLGLIGIGRVGSLVARRAAAFEMRIIASDPYATESAARAAGVTLVDLDTVLRESDVISLHTPLTPQTANLIDSTALAKLKPTAVLVNCSRGEIVDLAAVAAALVAGTLGGAAFDVFAIEPLPADSPIRTAPRTLLTPHLAGSTVEAQSTVAVDVARQILDVLDGRPASAAVNAPRPPSDEAGGPAWLLLAERLGALAAQLLDARPSRVDIAYHGSALDLPTEPLRAAVVTGIFRAFNTERVNLVNALSFAHERGLVVADHRETEPARYAALIEVRLGPTRVSGTTVQGEPRIVRIDDFWVDMPAEGHLLLTRHTDKPGLVGRVGTLLGQHDVNISSMQVSRLNRRGEALMILTLDDPVPDAVRDAVGAFADVEDVRTARLGPPAA